MYASLNGHPLRGTDFQSEVFLTNIVQNAIVGFIYRSPGMGRRNQRKMREHVADRGSAQRGAISRALCAGCCQLSGMQVYSIISIGTQILFLQVIFAGLFYRFYFTGFIHSL